MIKRAVMLSAACLLALGACGPNNDVGFYASGSLTATITTSNGDATVPVQFPSNTRVDPTLASHPTSRYVGRCSVGPTGREFFLQLATAEGAPLREVRVTLPPWDAPASATPGQVSVRLDTADTGPLFAGSERAAGTTTGPGCTIGTTRDGSFGMGLTLACSGLASAADPRTVSLDGQVQLEECDGPETSAAGR